MLKVKFPNTVQNLQLNMKLTEIDLFGPPNLTAALEPAMRLVGRNAWEGICKLLTWPPDQHKNVPPVMVILQTFFILWLTFKTPNYLPIIWRSSDEALYRGPQNTLSHKRWSYICHPSTWAMEGVGIHEYSQLYHQGNCNPGNCYNLLTVCFMFFMKHTVFHV